VSRGDRDPSLRRVPFGHNAGQLLKDVSDDELKSLREWCAEKDDDAGTAKFSDLINDIDDVLEDRQGLPLPLDLPPRRRR
jgi:hypothetical protein